MKRTLAVITTTLSLASGAALAQEPAAAPAAVPQTSTAAPPAAPPAAPQSNVSTLNGQLVEVGDHHRYQYDYKRWNASTNPIGWIIGSYGASLSYAPSKLVAVRGDLGYYNYGGSSGFEVGVAAPFYFRKMYSGFFLEPAFAFKALSEDDANGDSQTATVVGPQVSVGWHWYWDSGLNLQLSAGLGRNWNSNDSDVFDDRLNQVFPTGALRFGYAF